MKEHLIPNEVRLAVRVHPNAPRNELGGFTDDVLLVKVAATPVKGKANRELVDFISETLGISKSMVNIVKGETSHKKIISIQGLNGEEVMRRLTPPAKRGS